MAKPEPDKNAEKDERDLLDVLRAELDFLQKGGYARAPGESWRPAFIFEDSPVCRNYGHWESSEPCEDCVVMQLVPPEFRGSRFPCRHIPLNPQGETLDFLYRYADEHEIEDIYTRWLRSTIEHLEEQKRVVRETGCHSPISPDAVHGAPLKLQVHPKCANPACSVAFNWRQGGKFFRFRQDARLFSGDYPATDTKEKSHNVTHYWLCERCAHIFTLVHQEESGVVLRLIWPDFAPIAGSQGVRPEGRDTLS